MLRVINETNTAVISYELDKEGNDKCSVLIYDVVGDNLDVSSLSIEDDTLEVKSEEDGRESNFLFSSQKKKLPQVPLTDEF